MSKRVTITRRLASSAMLTLALGALVSLPGCGGARSTVSGSVTYDGQPVEDGSIRLHPTGDTQGQGGSAPIVGGRYEMKSDAGLLAGNYTVMISAFREASAAEIAARRDSEESGEEDDPERAALVAKTAARTQYLPPKYNQASEIKVELAPGENTKDFDLSK